MDLQNRTKINNDKCYGEWIAIWPVIKIAEEEGPGPLLVEVLQDPRCGQYPRLANFEYCREDLRVPLERDIAGCSYPNLGPATLCALERASALDTRGDVR